MNSRGRTFLILWPAALVLAACQTSPVEEKPAAAALAPAALPQFTEGYALTHVDPRTGKEESWRIVAVDVEAVSGLADTGCRWTTKRVWFAPALAWENCDPTDPTWTSGTRDITATRGEIWPLAVGNTVTFEHSYTSHTGARGSDTRTCTVEDAVHLTTVSGEHDAYKVVCKDRNRTRTWYWSPEVGEVAAVVMHKDSLSPEAYWQTVSAGTAQPQ